MTENVTEEWPYDAYRDDPLTALRIPVVGSSHPRWNYIVAFDFDQVDRDGNRPTEQEARQLRSFLDHYIDHWYNQTWKAKLKERPFDIDGGANGYIFRKYGNDDWGYRQRTWEIGPLFWPGPAHWRATYGKGPGAQQHSLVQVMDHVYTIANETRPEWQEWKRDHPEVFG